MLEGPDGVGKEGKRVFLFVWFWFLLVRKWYVRGVGYRLVLCNDFRYIFACVSHHETMEPSVE